MVTAAKKEIAATRALILWSSLALLLSAAIGPHPCRASVPGQSPWLEVAVSTENSDD